MLLLLLRPTRPGWRGGLPWWRGGAVFIPWAETPPDRGESVIVEAPPPPQSQAARSAHHYRMRRAEMAVWLRQSVAAEVKVGPFVDSTDGVTPETALTITPADVLLSKNGGDWAAKNEGTPLSHEMNGWYRCLLDAADLNTWGGLVLQVSVAGALPVWREFMVS